MIMPLGKFTAQQSHGMVAIPKIFGNHFFQISAELYLSFANGYFCAINWIRLYINSRTKLALIFELKIFGKVKIERKMEIGERMKKETKKQRNNKFRREKKKRNEESQSKK